MTKNVDLVISSCLLYKVRSFIIPIKIMNIFNRFLTLIASFILYHKYLITNNKIDEFLTETKCILWHV